MKLAFYNDSAFYQPRGSLQLGSLQLPSTGDKMTASLVDLNKIGQRRMYIPDNTTMTSLIVDMTLQNSVSGLKDKMATDSLTSSLFDVSLQQHKMAPNDGKQVRADSIALRWTHT